MAAKGEKKKCKAEQGRGGKQQQQQDVPQFSRDASGRDQILYLLRQEATRHRTHAQKLDKIAEQIRALF